MTTEEEDQGPPGYGALIRIAREAQGISPETAAARMPYRFSGSTWRQVEKGYKGAKRTPVSSKASTVAAMALTVGITADRLEEHHPEAAAIMRERERQEAAQTEGMPEVLNTAPAHVRRMIAVALEDVAPEDRPQLLREMAADYEAVRGYRSARERPQPPRRTG